MAGSDFGGVIRIKDSLGASVSLRGTLNIQPTDRSAEAVTDQDGSVDRIITPTAPEVEIAIADKAVDVVEFFNGPRRNVSIVEETNGRIHLVNDAFLAGRPQTNQLTGEVTGLRIVGSSYRRA